MGLILLRTLGRIDLRAPDGREALSILAQPKRLALLIYLAPSDSRRLHRREQLLALFWPHLDDAHARNSLSQALSTLRRGLHPDLFVTRGDEEIGLAAGMMDYDVSAFDSAHAAGRLDEALELYEGDFLDGLSLVDASAELDRWVEDERARLRAMAVGAALTLAAEAEGVMNVDAALEWARRAATIAPHEEMAVATKIRLMGEGGDRAGALLAYQEYVRWLAEELELEPSPELQAIAGSLRAQPPVVPSAMAPRDQVDPSPNRPAPAPASDASQARPRGEVHGVVASGRRAALNPVRGRRYLRGVSPIVLAAVLATLAGFALSGAAGDSTGGVRVAGPSSRAIAVLPFEDLCPGAGAEALVSGTHTELVTQLSRIGRLRVSSLFAVRPFAGSDAPAREIAAELQVGALLIGSLRCAGDRIRVSVQLVDPVSDRNIWADQFDRRRGDLFDIQSEIALAVAAELDAEPTPAERSAIAQRPTRSEEAYEIYLRAREYQQRPAFDEEDGRAAERLYLRALELDPGFALAHARLAGVHEFVYLIGWDRTPERLTAWREASETAVRLAPALPEAHFARASYWNGRQEYARALRELEPVLIGLPNDADAHLLLASIQCRLQRWTQCVDTARRIVQLESRAAGHLVQVGFSLWFMRHYREAVEAYDRALEIAPDYHEAALYRGRTFVDWLDTTDTLAAAVRDLPPEWDPDGVATANRILLAFFEREPSRVITAIDASPHAALSHWQYAVPFSLLRGRAYAELGDTRRARASYADAVPFLEDRVREEPEMGMRHALLGWAYAGVGRKEDAMREITLATELEPLSRDAIDGAAVLEQTAQVLTMLGDIDGALRQVEVLLEQPSPISIARLRREARWDPLRADPRFVRLLQDARVEASAAPDRPR